MSDTPVTVPVCYRHPSRETYVKCVRCDRPICPDCMRAASVGHQCPECVAEGRRTQRPARTAFGGGVAGREGYVTKTLIGLNVLVALLGVALSGAGALLGGGLFTSATRLQFVGAVVGPTFTLVGDRIIFAPVPDLGPVYTGIADGAYYRLIAAMFIHYGILHLLLNMWALWILGRELEAVLGPVRFLGLYLLAGLGGNVACYVFSPYSLSAGASTSIFGLFAAFFVILRRLKRDTSAILGLLVVNIVITVVFSQSISVAGHFGGLVFGALYGAVLAYAPRERRTLVQAAGGGAMLAILLVATLLKTLTLT